MRIMSTSLILAAAIGLMGCVVESPRRPPPPVVEYDRRPPPPPVVEYDRRPPRAYDRYDDDDRHHDDHRQPPPRAY